MSEIEECTQEIIQHKITKINGQVGVKRYIKGRILGKGLFQCIVGGFAKCYEGISVENKKMYAIKVIEKNTLQKSRAKQKLLSQIKIHKILHHKHIVEFDSVFEDQNNVYIILQLCTNKTLSQMVKKRKTLTTKEVRFYMLQLVSGLDYMHKNKVIHRDLKMGNIFLNANMDMKIGDFGLAAKLEFLEQKKRTMCGTPNYIAPEIVEGIIGHSYEVDYWSTGVICFAMLFGKPPFETSQVKSTYKKIKNCEYSFPSNSVSDDAKDFIKKILVLDPKQRLNVEQMMNHPFLNNEDIPRSIPIQALNTIPNFKETKANQQTITLTENLKLKPQDFGKNIQNTQNTDRQCQGILQGLISSRAVFNQNNNVSSKISDCQFKLDHKIYAITYVDYSTKYGLGYLINNKYYGVYFNDSSLISIDQEKTHVYYFDNASAKQQKMSKYKFSQIPKDRNFQKKYLLLQKFISHLNDELIKVQKVKFGKNINIQFQKDQNFVYIKQWLKTKHAIMFRLNNKIFQVQFFDDSQILLNTDKKTVKFTGKKGNIIYETLVGALQAKDNQLARRIKYTKQILNSIKKGKDIKEDQQTSPQN